MAKINLPQHEGDPVSVGKRSPSRRKNRRLQLLSVKPRPSRSIRRKRLRRSTEDVGDVLCASLQKVLTHFFQVDGLLAPGGDRKLVVHMHGSGGRRPRTARRHLPPTRRVGPRVCLLFSYLIRSGGTAVDGAVESLTACPQLTFFTPGARLPPVSHSPFLDRTLIIARCPPPVEQPHLEFTDLAATALVPEPFNSGETLLQHHFALPVSALCQAPSLPSLACSGTRGQRH
ncbi:hypothetical protein HPP92_020955 [Vanilla planifolia]|uniref:Uncharacterized protein n=1 Tax=Vanilla planifolia TaxID=51239 RepID=A0A835Q3P5_VANPL|nr:hypothetical protein HPP92_020955 [Vanilla planifolia]